MTSTPVPLAAAAASEVTLTEKTIYIPRMSDHVVALTGALRHFGIPSKILDAPDEETLSIGLDLCRGRECLPCFLCVGDMIRECRKPTFDREHAIFLMPASLGPCRFGQYRILQRLLLDAQGFHDVEILSPTSEKSYRGFGEHPNALRLLAWTGIVAVDLLLKLRYEHRPYELEAGATEAAYQRGLSWIEQGMSDGGGRHLLRAMDLIAEDFGALNTDRSSPKPTVAVVGEIYVMLNQHSNQAIIRQLEAAGAEVVTGTLCEWLHFADETKMDRDVLFGTWLSFLGTKSLSTYERTTERRLHRRVAHLLRQPADPPMRALMEMARPYFDPLLGTETLLTVSKVVHYASNGISGVVNVMPFSCMPGIVVTGLSGRLRQDFGLLPWLDINFDGQRITNIRTRLEAFIHQVSQFARSRRPT